MIDGAAGFVTAAKTLNEVSKNEQIRSSIASWVDRTVSSIRVNALDSSQLVALFSAYTQTSYTKCAFVKTFASEDAPVPISDIYVSPFFRYNGRRIDDAQAMEVIMAKKRTIIEATGGMGKTIFMKSFWTKIYNDQNFVIPVFFELKKYGAKETTDFVSFLRIHISQSNVSQELFDQMCQNGLLTFFFDGLDEVHPEVRPTVEKGIKFLSEKYPGVRIIVTTRPDAHVRGWDMFHVLRPMPLSQSEAIQVVEKISFDNEIKKNFIAKIRSELYARHKDFLSNPLLVNIMLLTYSEFAEIPEKVTIFYEYAFDVLYQRHDAKKDGYLREKKSGLAPDEFKDFFGYFCFSSYSMGLIEFRIEDFKKHVEVANKLSGFTVKPENFLDDLINAICMLREEGMNYVFSHRSFQEFFAAKALCRLDDERLLQCGSAFC
jgi:predicted NACHT family NTPase